jgi:hypothetical protein
MDTPTDVKRMRLRRDGACSGCSTALTAGTEGAWHAETRSVWCLACADPTPVPAGSAGASALREHGRRAAAREARIRAEHPVLGGLLLALAAEPTHQRAWATGSSGERAVAAGLDGLADVVLLHDRRMRGPDGRLSRANIDHLVVAPSGVWVVDAKQYAGSLEVRRAGGLLSPKVEQLWIAGRERTRLLDGVRAQAATVRRELDSAEAQDVPVHAALCFVGTNLPWFGPSSAQGVALVSRRGLRKLLRQEGPLDADGRTALARRLADRLPPA